MGTASSWAKAIVEELCFSFPVDPTFPLNALIPALPAALPDVEFTPLSSLAGESSSAV